MQLQLNQATSRHCYVLLGIGQNSHKEHERKILQLILKLLDKTSNLTLYNTISGVLRDRDVHPFQS